MSKNLITNLSGVHSILKKKPIKADSRHFPSVVNELESEVSMQSHNTHRTFAQSAFACENVNFKHGGHGVQRVKRIEGVFLTRSVRDGHRNDFYERTFGKWLIHQRQIAHADYDRLIKIAQRQSEPTRA
jgi:hypothetical protein